MFDPERLLHPIHEGVAHDQHTPANRSIERSPKPWSQSVARELERAYLIDDDRGGSRIGCGAHQAIIGPSECCRAEAEAAHSGDWFPRPERFEVRHLARREVDEYTAVGTIGTEHARDIGLAGRPGAQETRLARANRAGEDGDLHVHHSV